MSEAARNQSETVHLDKQASMIDDILAETRFAPDMEGYEVARSGLQALLRELLKTARSGERVDTIVVEAMIDEIDDKISQQIRRHKDKVRDRKGAPAGSLPSEEQ